MLHHQHASRHDRASHNMRTHPACRSALSGPSPAAWPLPLAHESVHIKITQHTIRCPLTQPSTHIHTHCLPLGPIRLRALCRPLCHVQLPATPRVPHIVVGSPFSGHIGEVVSSRVTNRAPLFPHSIGRIVPSPSPTSSRTGSLHTHTHTHISCSEEERSIDHTSASYRVPE